MFEGPTADRVFLVTATSPSFSRIITIVFCNVITGNIFLHFLPAPSMEGPDPVLPAVSDPPDRPRYRQAAGSRTGTAD
jgi:hypothetical protein